jgi:hypothetical protein
MGHLLTPAPPSLKMVEVPIAEVKVLPALLVPVVKRVSVEMGVRDPEPEPPVPAAPPAKMVDSPTAVVMVLPPVVMVEKVVSVETGVRDSPEPEPEPEPPEPAVPVVPPEEAARPPVAETAEVAGRAPTEVPALEAEAATGISQCYIQIPTVDLETYHWSIEREGRKRRPKDRCQQGRTEQSNRAFRSRNWGSCTGRGDHQRCSRARQQRCPWSCHSSMLATQGG